MEAAQAKIGLVGLAVMGENLALNIERHGFPIAVYNRAADGALTLSGMVPTGGAGTGGGLGNQGGVILSRDGRWLLVEWRTADQWVFVRLDGTRPFRAVSAIARQFRGKAVVEGWCCGR